MIARWNLLLLKRREKIESEAGNSEDGLTIYRRATNWSILLGTDEIIE